MGLDMGVIRRPAAFKAICAARSNRATDPSHGRRDFNRLLTELYPEKENLFDHNDYLDSPYQYSFKGDPALVAAVFQAVGFATQHGLMVPDDGSEPHQRLGVDPVSRTADF
jgi:hypothetical protein